MSIWTAIALVVIGVGFGLAAGNRLWRRRRRDGGRTVELPNSHYVAPGVRRQVDRERWDAIRLEELHPVNREEVSRLLALVAAAGPQALSPRERQFLETMVALAAG